MNDLEKLVLRQIGESVASPDVFSEGSDALLQVRRSINDAVQEVSMLTGAVKQTYLIPLVAETTFYRLWLKTDYVGWITDAWLVSNRRRLEQTDRFRLDKTAGWWLKHRGTPEAYFPVGLETVGIYPAPSGSTDVIELHCVVIPAPYVRDTERVRLRDTHKWAVVHHAVAEYYASRGAPMDAAQAIAQYADALGLARSYGIAPETKYRARTEKDPWPTEGERRPVE